MVTAAEKNAGNILVSLDGGTHYAFKLVFGQEIGHLLELVHYYHRPLVLGRSLGGRSGISVSSSEPNPDDSESIDGTFMTSKTMHGIPFFSNSSTSCATRELLP